jgi:predicted MFS family arabinose efflux permease
MRGGQPLPAVARACPGRRAGDGDAAQAAVQLLGGICVVAGPYLLGSLADALGLRAAFAIEPALIVMSALLLAAGRRAGHRAADKG